MLRFALALVIGSVLSTQAGPPTPTGAQVGPDLSGRWNRESASTEGTGAPGTWGSRVDIGRFGTNVTVKNENGKVQEYRPDGKETAEVLTTKGCAYEARITKYQPAKDHVTITTWLVIKSGCFHGETDDEPFVYRTGPIEVKEVPGTRRLESITDVYREGDMLRVDTTRTAPALGGPTTSTTTIYRR